jgi:hypothetical protein
MRSEYASEPSSLVQNTKYGRFLVLVHEAEHLLVTAAGRHLPEPVVPVDRVRRLNGGGDHPVHRAPLFSALPPERSASGSGSVRGIDPPIVDDSR